MIKNTLTVSMLACSFCVSTAYASDFYVGGKVGISNVVNACENSNNCDEESFSVGAYAGYDFNDYIAAEIGYDYLGSFDANFSKQNSGVVNKKLTVSALTFAPKFSYPINNELDVFGKVGAAQLLSSSEGDMVTTAALGLEYAVNRNVTLRGEYQYFHDMQDKDIYNLDANVFALGVTYVFGEEERVQTQTEPELEEPITVVVSHPTVKETVLFEFNAKTFSEEYHEGLKAIIVLMEQYPDTQATVLGYADPVGNPQYNLTLSQQRAEAVASFLIENGITSERLTVSGEGETDESQDDANNRHVDVTIDAFTYETKN
ncbi:OmpA family protein [Vibrio owensii]|nr:OmpA family protein [Vibrio owensii]